MKRAIVFPLLALAACTSPGERPVPESEIIDFGIFEVEQDPARVRRDLSVDGGETRSEQAEQATGPDEQPEYKLVEQTAEIPLAPNTLFGFSWCSRGHPDGLTPLEIIIESPLVTDDGPGTQHFRRLWILGEVVNGEICRTETHLISEDQEITPGVWTISVTIDGDTVISQEFTITK